MNDLQPNLIVYREQTIFCLNSLCRHVYGCKNVRFYVVGSNEALQNEFDLWTNLIWSFCIEFCLGASSFLEAKNSFDFSVLILSCEMRFNLCHNFHI